MSSEQESGNSRHERLSYWQPGKVWFSVFYPNEVPWSGNEVLEDLPEEVRGEWGIKVSETTYVDKQRYDPGNLILVENESGLIRLLQSVSGVSGMIVPWFEKIIPASLWKPKTETINLADYRAKVKQVWIRSFLITAGLAALGYFQPAFLMIALLGATIYGLFPLVESSMAWFRRVDRYSLEELNRRLVNTELFRIWLAGQSTLILKIAVAVLVFVQVGQFAVDAQAPRGQLSPSIEAAALVKGKVFENGEWWRLVTTGLMHGGILHILFNGMALFSLGRVIVGLANGWFLSFVFLVSVVTGSLASLYLGSAPASVGASGGILGCLGFLLVVCYRFREKLPSFLGISLVQSTIVVSIFGFLGAAFIDNAAHAGGLLGGVVIGLVAFPRMKLASPDVTLPIRFLGGLSCVILILGLVKVGMELWALR